MPSGGGHEADCGDDGRPADARLRENRRLTITRIAVALLAVLAGVCMSGCRKQDVVAAKAPPQMIWRAVGTWSGQGNRQTESFTSDTGALRVKWQTTSTGTSAAAGGFRLTAHSAISGRVL